LEHDTVVDLVRRAGAGAGQAQHPGRAREADLTATPRCKFPQPAYLKRAVDTGIFERVHVRIYDDDNCEAYWHLAWDRWTAAYPAMRFYVGMTTSEMTHGWVHTKNVYYDVAPSVQRADNYSGFMIWDRYADKLSNYTSMVKSKGVPVSLSIGGFDTGYSLPSRQATLDLFEHLWNSYFGGSKPGVHCSFGDAWLDVV
ncbi:Xylanase inhibitor protein 1, partial [Dichanthelium oligosanthes]